MNTAGRRFISIVMTAAAIILTSGGCAWLEKSPQLPEQAEFEALKLFLSDRNALIFVKMNETETRKTAQALNLQQLKLRPARFAEISPFKIIDAETGEPGFLLELHDWKINQDGSITLKAALYYNSTGGEFYTITLVPEGEKYRITQKNSEIIF